MFKKNDNRLIAYEEAYDTHGLNQLAENNRWLSERGNHGVITFLSKSNTAASYIHERPFVSATGWASILQMPWFVSRGLKTLKFRALVRLGAGNSNGEAVPDTGWTGYVRARLWGRAEPIEVSVLPVRVGDPSFGDWGWQYVEWEYELGPGVEGVYEILSLEIRTEIPNRTLSDTNVGVVQTELVRRDVWGPVTDRLEVENVMYGLGTAAIAPQDTAPEVTATILSTAANEVVGLVDHGCSTLSGRGMHVWPRAAALAEQGGDDMAVHAKKTYAAYFHFRSFEVEEVYQPEDFNRRAMQAHRAPVADSLLAIAGGVTTVAERKMLLGFANANARPFFGRARWLERGYVRLHREFRKAVSVDEPARITVSTGRAPKVIEVALSVIGLYAAHYAAEESAEDTREKSVSGYMRVSVQLHPDTAAPINLPAQYEHLTYTLTNRSGAHYLVMKRLDQPTTLVYREGYVAEEDQALIEQKTLRFDVSELDIDWSNPVQMLVQIHVHHGAYEPEPNELVDYPMWLDKDVAASLPTEPAVPVRPNYDAMTIALTGVTVWGME